MDAGKFKLITEADYVLSRCGRFQPPVGSVVYIPKSFLVQAVLPVAPSNQTFYKEITGDTTWCWRSISTALSATMPAVSAQVLKPDGKFLFNGLLDLTAVQGFGSYRYLLTNELEVPPGSKIQLNLDDNYLDAQAVQPVSMLFGGAYAYYLKNGRRSPSCVEESAAALPRVFAGVNQNLLAPCWMAGEGPSTPDGWEDIAFTYGDGCRISHDRHQSSHGRVDSDRGRSRLSSAALLLRCDLWRPGDRGDLSGAHPCRVGILLHG